MMIEFKKGKSRLAAIAVTLLFCFSATAQSEASETEAFGNVVIFDSPDYLMFRWGADTLDTSGFAGFFLYMGKTADTLQAGMMGHQIVYFLRQQPTAVNRVDEAMKQTLFLSLDDYAAWARLEEKKIKVVKE